MIEMLVVGTGGFVGAMLRFWLSGVVQRWSGGGFPHGTLVVNVLGCLVMGTVMGLIEHRQSFGHHTRILLTFGILGGFTTFSAFGYETFALLRANQYLPAMANVVLNVVACTAAVGVGWYATKAIAA